MASYDEDGWQRQEWADDPGPQPNGKDHHHAADQRVSRFFPASAFEGRPIPPQQWHVEGLIPSRTVTMLGGDGGTGKSLLALMLACSTALGSPWLGYPVREGGALYLTAEDDEDELHRRLSCVLAAERASFSDLSRLNVRSLAGEDALLAIADPKTGVLMPTELFHELDARIGHERPSLVGLDTLADLHSGNENDRTTARQFIGLLRGLAIRHDCAVLLLAHPSLSGMSSGSGLSGSTAWNGSVRSRLYLERIVQDGYEPDPDKRILSTKKANHARIGGEIAVTWRDGVFVADAPEADTSLDRMAATAKAERVFLKLLDEFTAQGRYVAATPSTTYAPAVFAKHPEAEGMTKRALAPAMEALLHRGVLVIAHHGWGASKRTHLGRAGA